MKCITMTTKKERTSFLDASSASFFSFASRCRIIKFSRSGKKSWMDCQNSNLCLLFLQLLASFTLLNDPLGNFVNTLAWTRLVFEKITLQSSNLEQKISIGIFIASNVKCNLHLARPQEWPRRTFLQAQRSPLQ